MSTIKISNETHVIEHDPWETVYDYNQKGRFRLQVIGEVRASSTKFKAAIGKLALNHSNLKSIHQFFCTISGTYVIFIGSTESITLIPCYSYPLFYILNEQIENNRTLVLTNLERAALSGGINAKRFVLRAASKQGFFIPKGIGAAVKDFLIPGMSMRISKDTLSYEQSWVFPLHRVAERTDHENAARDIANALVEEMSSYKLCKREKVTTLQLSSGLDSALLLAASRNADLDVTPVNFHTPISSQECIGAKQTAKFFGLNLLELLRGPSKKGSPFTKDTDISNYLESMAGLLKTGSPMFILDDMSLLAPYHFGNHCSIEGSSYPTQLCIQHNTTYPVINRNINKLINFYRFDPKIGHDQRKKYSLRFARQKLNSFKEPKVDKWKISESWHYIHPFYWEYLEPCFTGSFKGDGLTSKYFPSLSCGIDIDPIFYDAALDRGKDFIEKILLSNYVKSILEKPDPLSAVKIYKIIAFVNMAVFANAKLYNYRASGIMNQQRPGLSSNILNLLQTICIDDVIVNYPKWHLFRAFELLAGKSFFHIHSYVPFKKYMVQKFYYYKYGRNRVKANLKTQYINNKSVQSFIKKEDIWNRYQNLKRISIDCPRASKALELIESICRNNIVAQYWYLNHTMNTAFLTSELI